MKLIQALGGETRSSGGLLSLDDYLKQLRNFGLFGQPRQTLGQKQEEPDPSFEGYVQSAYKANGIVFACMLARLMLFSEARFQFRRRLLGRPGELYGTQALEPLEKPWAGGTTGKLLTRVMQDGDLAGNFYGAIWKGGIKRLRPDWVTMVLGSHSDPEVGYGDIDAELLGYMYSPGGPHSGKPVQAFLPNEVAHYAPIPDPLATFRGMSWLTPIIREIMADQAAADHKLKYFEQGATPNLVVSFDADIEAEQFEEWVDLIAKNHDGAANAYKTLYLAKGASADVIGSDLKNVDFKKVQAAGETRIAVAAGVPGIVVGLAEGLEAGTLANYGQARRHFADATIRPLWREIAGSFETIVEAPRGSELWYDSRDISYLQEDQKDGAEIQNKEATTIKTLIEAGYQPDAVVEAVTAEDLSRLKGSHTGMTSVQLHPPGTGEEEAPPEGQ